MKYNTKIGEFCATHKNWQELLQEKPYCLKIKFTNTYVIFNYNQIESDFYNPIVQEARGIIFDLADWTKPVCHAFNKFFNYGEPNCAEIDWSTATVSQKIDGSIMKVWWDGCWRVSTNANIYAEEAEIGDARVNNFREVFDMALTAELAKINMREEAFWDSLNISFTYIFELVSPFTRVVIPYDEPKLYFLGARHNSTGIEYGCTEQVAKRLRLNFFDRPKLYPITSLDECISAAKELDWDEEGYVVFDSNMNRCKIKSPAYVIAHYCRTKRELTKKNLIDIIIKAETDEFLIYADDYREQIQLLQQRMHEFRVIVALMAANGAVYRNRLTKKETAERIKNEPKMLQAIIFDAYNKDFTAEEYTANWNANKWEKVLDEYEKIRMNRSTL